MTGVSWDITVKELAEKQARGEDLVLIDVREPSEWAIARIPGALLVPLRELPAYAGALDNSREIVLHCHHGLRSMHALQMLRRSGFQRLRNLRGGIDAWSREVDPTVPRY